MAWLEKIPSSGGRTIKQLAFNQMLKNRLIKFLLVGFINTLFGFSLYTLLILLHFHFVLASLLSTVLGILFNFQTVGRLVFKNHRSGLIFRFFGVYCLTYLLNITLLAIFDYLQVNVILAGGITMLPIALLSYELNKRYVFSRSDYDEAN